MRGFSRIEDPPNPNGRRSVLTDRQVHEMVRIVLTRPADLGLPYMQWSLGKLRGHLTERQHFLHFSREWFRMLLLRECICLPRTKSK